MSSSSSTRPLMTPEEAGKRAQALALSLLSDRTRTGSTIEEQGSTSMATLLAHAGIDSMEDEQQQQPQHNAPMAPPLHVATTYTRPADGVYLPSDSIYGRHDNPTRLLFEREMGRLECHGYASSASGSASMQQQLSSTANIYSCAFASGMMAVSSIILAHSSPLLVLIPHDLYHGVPSVLLDVFERFHVTTKRVNLSDPHTATQNLRDALSSEKQQRDSSADSSSSSLSSSNFRDVIVWMETPSNPLCQIIDIAAICQTVQQIRMEKLDQEDQADRCFIAFDKITTVVDSTLAPPPISQPLLLGADLVMHSATKYLAGHSDATLGVVTVSPFITQQQRGNQEDDAWLGPRLQQVQRSIGGVASPWDCWLALRGMKTLHIRVARQCQTALTLAHFLESHPLVTHVHYPGLESHPQHAIAKRQMNHQNSSASSSSAWCGGGGLLSFELPTAQQAMACAAALTVISRATSLGGSETLIEHRASIEPPALRTSPWGLLRLSVGLEDAHDLMADLNKALDISQQVVVVE